MKKIFIILTTAAIFIGLGIGGFFTAKHINKGNDKGTINYKVVEKFEFVRQGNSVYVVFFKENKPDAGFLFRKEVEPAVFKKFKQGKTYSAEETEFLSLLNAEQVPLFEAKQKEYKYTGYSSRVVEGYTVFSVHFKRVGDNLEFYKDVEMDSLLFFEQGRTYEPTKMPLKAIGKLERLPFVAEKPDKTEKFPGKKK